MATKTEKECLFCHKPILIGRSDKKFCHDKCRTDYSNAAKSTNDAVIKRTNIRLLKNRNILKSILGTENMTKIEARSLVKAGFNFNFHTNIYKSKRGDVYTFCYDYGYLQLENQLLLIVKSE